jgi:arylsulfatase A-like enzyme
MWATFAELAGGDPPEGTDGISIVPTLLGRGVQRDHDLLYWEFHSKGSSQAVRMGRWKGVRNNAAKPGATIELYDLEQDPGETTNAAAAHPDVVRRIEAAMKDSHTGAVLPAWNFTRP